MSLIGEKILLMLSRKTETADYDESVVKNILGNSLQQLNKAFSSNFLEDINNKVILDYGCGTGFQVVEMALKGAKFVLGVDIREAVFQEGIKLANEYHVNEKVKFLTEVGEKYYQHFDIIVSKNSFEHYNNIQFVIALWEKIIKPEGRVYITFCPLWYAPYGAHVSFFTKVPWVNLIFSERTVMKVRSNFRSDGAKRYEEVDGGINKMSVRKFEEVMRGSKFTLEYMNYKAVKRIGFLTKLPGVRELFINQIDCILKKV